MAPEARLKRCYKRLLQWRLQMAPGLAPEDWDGACKWCLQWRLDWCLKIGDGARKRRYCCMPSSDHRTDAKTGPLTGIAPVGIARKTQRCKEGTVSSFYALRLVFILFNFLFVLVRRINRRQISKFNLYKTMILNIWIQPCSDTNCWYLTRKLTHKYFGSLNSTHLK